MSSSVSPLIISSQTGPHKNLQKLLARHVNSDYQATIPQHAIEAFEKCNTFVQSRKQAVVLDSGCGTGESSYRLAKQYPQLTVVGMDKSSHRLERHYAHGEQPSNLIFVRCDCVHFWLLMKQSQWQVAHHYLLYPNPWPKPGHLQRRWHGHPIFPAMIELSDKLTLRTNWDIYAQEFVQAINLISNKQATLNQLENIDSPLTPFERKYLQSEHELYEVKIN